MTQMSKKLKEILTLKNIDKNSHKEHFQTQQIHVEDNYKINIIEKKIEIMHINLEDKLSQMTNVIEIWILYYV